MPLAPSTALLVSHRRKIIDADVPKYRHAEFERRKSVEFAGISTWITSREDLILSKLVWGGDSGSDMQLRDVRTLIDDSVDWLYPKDWAAKWASPPNWMSFRSE